MKQFWKDHWQWVIGAVGTVVGAALTVVLVVVPLRYEKPEQFGHAPSLVYFDAPKNALASERDEAWKNLPQEDESSRSKAEEALESISDLKHTELTVTIENPSASYPAEEVAIVIASVDASKMALKVHHGVVIESNSDEFNTVYSAPAIPAGEKLSFTVAQDVEFFPGEYDPDNPPSGVRYQYSPVVVSIRYKFGDAVRDSTRCDDSVLERYSSDALGKNYKKYCSLCKAFAQFSIGIEDEEGNTTALFEIGKKMSEQLATADAKAKRFVAKKRQQPPVAVILGGDDDEELKVPDFDGQPMITVYESALEKIALMDQEMCLRFLLENEAIAKRWIEEFPEVGAFLLDPKTPPPKREIPPPWETVPRFLEEHPEFQKRWFLKYPQAKRYLEELKEADGPFPPKLTFPPPWEMDNLQE